MPHLTEQMEKLEGQSLLSVCVGIVSAPRRLIIEKG